MTGGAIIEDLVQQGKITPDSKLTLARVGVGVAVRAGLAKPDITSEETVRALLRAVSPKINAPTHPGPSASARFPAILDCAIPCRGGRPRGPGLLCCPS
jgi:hypothetical protein